MRTLEDLRQILKRIDGKGYKAYKDIEGEYEGDECLLFVDHVQGDPFATPSKLRIRIFQHVARIPEEMYSNRTREIAARDFFARRFAREIKQADGKIRGTGKSGLVYVDAGGQEVLERTAAILNREFIEIRLQVGLPAAGRRILGNEAAFLLCDHIPAIARRSLLWQNTPSQEAKFFVACIENQEEIRRQLLENGLVAFLADGSILPRESGISDRPMARGRAIPFHSPDSLRVTFPLKNPLEKDGTIQYEVTGMGIPTGVTLIVGGGYHGKSTLLKALERGVYPHIPGDGREFVITIQDAVKIRAEDGRRIEQTNIRPFIDRLPLGQSTENFSTEDASGSTSQAANIIEALEIGTRLLLVDEDTSATNFMIRDARMQALVHKDHEPITPFIDRVRELYERHGVSTVLVMGGSGDYFDVADTVIMMKEYLPLDVTHRAKELAKTYVTQRRTERPNPFSSVTPRIPLAYSLDPSKGKKAVKIDVRGPEVLLFGRESVDLRYLEQLVDTSQTRAIGYAIYLAQRLYMDGKRTLADIMSQLEQLLDEKGLDALALHRRSGQHPGNLARPRKHEIAAALNRMRSLKVRQKTQI
jgi:predicted ABC-class ATPase